MFTELLKKVKGKFTARPSILRPADGGEIVLKNCTNETKAKVAVAIGLESKPEVPKVEESPKYASPENIIEYEVKSTLPMHSTALGIYQDPLTLSWHMVTLKYSHISKEAQVVDDQDCGKFKEYATEKFRIAAVNKNLVG